MHLIKNYLVLFLPLLWLSSCSTDAVEITIDPFESYRYGLWKKMLDSNMQFDFIGTQIDAYAYPNYLGQVFDVEHQGVGSIETDGVLVSLQNVLVSIDKPDVVLLGIGINDLLAEDVPGEVIRNVSSIIEALQQDNPSVTIFVEQIPPLRSDLMTLDLTRRLFIYNRMIVQLAIKKSNVHSRVIPIDMFTNFLDRYFADQVHYNEEGAQFVSQKYYNAIAKNCVINENLKILPLGDSRVVGYRQ
jgi:hypothetical protein